MRRKQILPFYKTPIKAVSSPDVNSKAGAVRLHCPVARRCGRVGHRLGRASFLPRALHLPRRSYRSRRLHPNSLNPGTAPDLERGCCPCPTNRPVEEATKNHYIVYLQSAPMSLDVRCPLSTKRPTSHQEDSLHKIQH